MKLGVILSPSVDAVDAKFCICNLWSISQAGRRRLGLWNMQTDWWSAEGFELSEAKPLPAKPDVCRPCAYLDPLVHCTHLRTQTVRWNGGLRQLPRGPLCSRIHLICGPPTANYSFVAGDCVGNNGIDEQHGG